MKTPRGQQLCPLKRLATPFSSRNPVNGFLYGGSSIKMKTPRSIRLSTVLLTIGAFLWKIHFWILAVPWFCYTLALTEQYIMGVSPYHVWAPRGSHLILETPIGDVLTCWSGRDNRSSKGLPLRSTDDISSQCSRQQCYVILRSLMDYPSALYPSPSE